MDDTEEFDLWAEGDNDSEARRSLKPPWAAATRYTSDRPSSAPVMRRFIREISCEASSTSKGVTDYEVIGVVIAKQEPRAFISKAHCGERWRLAFTVRDSPKDWINATCWGEEQWVQRTAEAFAIGDAVEIRGAKLRKLTEEQEKFGPFCPYPCALSLIESTGSVTYYLGRELSTLASLLRMPLKNVFNVDSLESLAHATKGSRANLLVGIKSFSGSRTVETKYGRRSTATLRVADETCTHFEIKTWNREEIQLFRYWPVRSVAYFQNVKIINDDYRKCVVAQTDARTMIQHSPESTPARRLSNWMRDLDLTSFTAQEDHAVDIADVKDVVEVADVWRIVEEKRRRLHEEAIVSPPVYVVVYGMLTSFPIDADDETAYLLRRCVDCRKRLRRIEDEACLDCRRSGQTGLGVASNHLDRKGELEFGVVVEVSDQTGTLTRVWVGDDVIRRMLEGLMASEFLGLEESLKTKLKWKFLLMSAKMKLRVDLRRTLSSEADMVKLPSIQMLDWRTAESEEDQLDALVNWD